MKIITKRWIAFLLSLVLILSAYLPTFAVESAQSNVLVYSKSANSGERDVVCTTLEGTSAEDYYTGNYAYDNLDDLSSSQLLSTLRKLMTDTHSYTSSYNDCHYKADKTDCENENGKVVLIYTSYTATMEQWDGWNREHVWPQSLGGDNTKGGGADLHHIRPSDAGVNSSRGNKKYGYSNNGTEKYGSNPAVGYLGGTYNSTYFEPLDNVKGDVARIVLYVWVRWGSDWGADNVTKVFQSVDVLLEWCKLDPVDTWEMGRNEVIEEIQGNRNVFIDYPELAWLLFDREIPGDMTTPSGMAEASSCDHTNCQVIEEGVAPTCTEAGKSAKIYCNTVERYVGGKAIPATGHTQGELKDASAATCVNSGFTGDKYCLTCGVKVVIGTTIPATGVHDYGDWTLSPDGVTYKKCCKGCDSEVIMDMDILLSSIDSDAEKILLLLTLGANSSVLLNAISK